MKSFPDNNDYSDWGKIWGEINVYIQPGQRYRFIHVEIYIYFWRETSSQLFSNDPPPPLLPPLEIAQRHKFVNRKSCIHKLAP